jgi:uncharacterized protein (TIGR02646 family)
MIPVEFNPEKLAGAHAAWWEKWLAKANDASELARKEGESGNDVAFQDGIWTELKRWLLENEFHGKCAYCESETEVTGYAAADHYRPKGRVASVDNHVGYYWVAYEWRNLVPCCNRCNTGAKRDLFPVDGRRVSHPKDAGCTVDLNKIEQPLILSPYDNGDASPREHLTFTEFGHVIPKEGSVRGQKTIEVCDLQRDRLKNKRKANQESAWLRWLYLNGDRGKLQTERQTFCQQIRSGKIEHSAAIYDAIRERSEELLKEI